MNEQFGVDLDAETELTEDTRSRTLNSTDTWSCRVGNVGNGGRGNPFRDLRERFINDNESEKSNLMESVVSANSLRSNVHAENQQNNSNNLPGISKGV